MIMVLSWRDNGIIFAIINNYYTLIIGLSTKNFFDNHRKARQNCRFISCYLRDNMNFTSICKALAKEQWHNCYIR